MNCDAMKCGSCQMHTPEVVPITKNVCFKQMLLHILNQTVKNATNIIIISQTYQVLFIHYA